MPYLQVDFDAMERWPMVATGCTIKLDAVYRGFLELWKLCWRQKSGYIGLLQIECLFDMPGRGERAIEVLCALGFLEKRGGGYWVCGSEKYLRVAEARSRGGKSAQSNLKRGKSPGSSRKPAGKQPENSPGSAPALTAVSIQQSANIETKDPVGPLADVAPEERVFEHWKKVMGKNGNTAFDSGRKSKVQARLRDGYSPESLCQAVDGCAKTPHNMGENERGERYDDIALICRDAAHVDRFMQNATAPPKRAGNARDITRGMVRAQDVDQTSFAKIGISNDL